MHTDTDLSTLPDAALQQLLYQPGCVNTLRTTRAVAAGRELGRRITEHLVKERERKIGEQSNDSR